MTHPMSPIFRALVQVAFFLINLLALHLFLRGHDAPGGGFIAGVCSAIALVLLSLGITVAQARRTVRWRSARVAGIGGLVALGTATAPMLFGHPFLAHFQVTTPELPLVGAVSLSTAMLFDLGVYGIVVGVVAKILFAFGLSTAGKSALVRGEEDLFSASFEEPVEAETPAGAEDNPAEEDDDAR